MSGLLCRGFTTAALKVVNDVAKKQFVISTKSGSGNDAILAYELEGKKITFISTDVPPEFQGKGVGKLLAQYAFDHAKNQNLEVLCKCHFLAKFYEKNINQYRSLKVKFEL